MESHERNTKNMLKGKFYVCVIKPIYCDRNHSLVTFVIL